jgi:protein archease
MSDRAGHRIVPHTADCIIEAWGPDRAGCLTEALLALVQGFAEIGHDHPTQVVPIGAGPGRAEDELVALLEQVIFSVDALSVVPVRFHLGETDRGGVAGEMEVVPADDIVVVGPVPKGVSYHELSMVQGEGGWRCRLLVDV